MTISKNSLKFDLCFSSEEADRLDHGQVESQLARLVARAVYVENAGSSSKANIGDEGEARCRSP